MVKVDGGLIALPVTKECIHQLDFAEEDSKINVIKHLVGGQALAVVILMEISLL